MFMTASLHVAFILYCFEWGGGCIMAKLGTTNKNVKYFLKYPNSSDETFITPDAVLYLIFHFSLYT